MIEDALLWELTSEDTNHTSYLFGTIHLSSPSTHVFIHALEKLCNDVQVIYTETSLDQSVDPIHYLIPKDQTLKDLVSERKYFRAARIFKKAFNVDLEQFDRILPLLTAQNIGLISQNMHVRPSLDSQIYQIAVRKELDYQGLELMDEQLEIMKQIPLDYQVKALFGIARNVRRFRKSFKKLVELYDNQRITRLYKSSKKTLGPIRKLLLYDRNELMAQRIQRHHPERPALFTFGAGHLTGNKGVLPLLKRKGMMLRPMSIGVLFSSD